MNKRQAQKQKTRSLILETSRELLRENGITSFRTLDVAKRAGLAHGSIFLHFATRETLIKSVIEAFGKVLIENLHEAAQRQVGLKAVLAAHLESIKTDEAFYASVFADSRQLPPSARQVLLTFQSVASFHIFISAEIEMNAGRLKPVPMHLLFNTWIGLLHHYLFNHNLFAPGGSVIEKVADELIDHFMHLLSIE